MKSVALVHQSRLSLSRIAWESTMIFKFSQLFKENQQQSLFSNPFYGKNDSIFEGKICMTLSRLRKCELIVWCCHVKGLTPFLACNCTSIIMQWHVLMFQLLSTESKSSFSICSLATANPARMLYTVCTRNTYVLISFLAVWIKISGTTLSCSLSWAELYSNSMKSSTLSIARGVLRNAKLFLLSQYKAKLWKLDPDF